MFVIFTRFDENKDKFICFDELKRAMEKLEAPQTHLALKAMIKEIDEDLDGKINFREVFLVFSFNFYDSSIVLSSYKPRAHYSKNSRQNESAELFCV